MLTQPVSLVVFDAVGTLLEPCPSVAEAYLHHARDYGVRLTPDEIRPRFRQAMRGQSQLDRRVEGRTSSERELARWRTIVAEVFAEIPDTTELFDRFWRHFALPEHWRVTPDAALAIARLEAAGIPWAIGSNFDERLPPLCRELAPLSLCPADRIFVSALVGHLKPFAGFFRHIEDATDLPADELLLIGDDAENDYDGATAAGWQAILLDEETSLVEIAHAVREVTD